MRGLSHIFLVRFYEVHTGQDNLTSAFEISRFGPSADQLEPELDTLSWWRKEGGYHHSNACNRHVLVQHLH